jgi:hypothetical protein
MMRQMSREDYIYCEDCKEFVDLWKYGDIDDTGHANHNWRFVSEKELKECIQDCWEMGCFREGE